MQGMTGAVGLRNIILIVILLAVNAVAGAASYMYLSPESIRLDREFRGIKTKVMGVRSETDSLRTDFDKIKGQKDYFEQLKNVGFFNDQDRVRVLHAIESMQRYSRVSQAVYDIQPPTIEKTQDANVPDDLGQVVLTSPVKVEIDAIDDLDFYSFLHLVDRAFPGQTSITGIEVTAPLKVNEAALRQIGTGVPTTLIKGTIQFGWHTMVPRDSAAAMTAGGSKTGL